MKQEDLKRYLELVSEQIGFCINVTSRLLKLSRKPEKEYRPVDLNEVISETACLLEYEAKKQVLTLKSKNPIARPLFPRQTRKCA